MQQADLATSAAASPATWVGRAYAGARRSAPTLLLLSAVLAAYTNRYLRDSSLPHEPRLGSGWWSWWDQGEYFRAAQAWAGGDFNPDLHWYFPGYPILGSLFYRLMPAHPFFLPDATLLLLALYLFVEICAVLDVDRTKAAIIFIATILVPPAIIEQFVVPWTTTPAMVLIAAVLLAALRYCETPAPRWAFAGGMGGAALVLFRPTDLIVLVPAVTFCAAAALRRGARGHVLRDIAAFSGAFAVPGAIAVAVHLVIYGPHESAYMLQAAGIGFDFSQLPTKWVTIFLDPTPVFPGGEGILGAYPWLCFGIVGAVQFSIFKRSRQHALVAAVMLAYSALYLCFIDLLPTNLWDFNIIHYFKWLFPFFGLFAFLALRSLGDRESWRSLAAALMLSAAPLSLHLKLVPVARALVSSDRARNFVVDVSGPVSVIDVPLAQADGRTLYPAYLPSRREKVGRDWILRPIVDAPDHELSVDDEPLAAIRDFQIFPSPSGARIVLLRRAARRVIAAQLAKGNALSAASDVATYSTALAVGWPAWLRFGDALP